MKLHQFNISPQDIMEALRRLAKSVYWQSIYNSKEHGFKLFNNDKDLTSLQLEFVHLLGYYSNIISEVGAGLVSEKILESDTYINAYYYYKQRSIKNEKQKAKNDLTKSKFGNNSVHGDQWVFK